MDFLVEIDRVVRIGEVFCSRLGPIPFEVELT